MKSYADMIGDRIALHAIEKFAERELVRIADLRRNDKSVEAFNYNSILDACMGAIRAELADARKELE